LKPADAARLGLLSAIWGSSFLFIALGLRGLSPMQLVTGRLLVGAATLLILLRLRGLQLPKGRQAWTSLAIMALISNIIPFGLISWGQEHITSSLAAILNSTTPLFTGPLAAVLIPGEKMSKARAIGVLTGFVGVAVIVGVETSGSIVAELAVVIAAASYGVGFVYARVKLGKHGSPLSLSTGQILAAAAIMIPVAGVDVALQPPSPSLESVLAVAALGVGGTGISYVLFYRLIHDVGATTASFVTYLIPIFAVILGTIFLDDRLGANVLLGAALVIGGIALAERARAVSQPEPPEMVVEEP
jgi:drug/metabolite transporter (DMT)-like permease